MMNQVGMLMHPLAFPVPDVTDHCVFNRDTGQQGGINQPHIIGNPFTHKHFGNIILRSGALAG